MLLKLFIISLLSIAAFSSGIYVNGGRLQTVDDWKCLRQTSPDFAIIAMDLRTQNWTQFAESHQNALTAGYKHIHVSIASWQPLQPGSLPKSFSGRVWITGNAGNPYSALVSMVEDIASQGYNAGILDGNLFYYSKGDEVPSVVSSLPFAFNTNTKFLPWIPFGGWQCPALNIAKPAEQCGQIVEVVSQNPTCV